MRLLSSPREPALRKARICYDHLAGELGVTAFEAMLECKVFARTPDGIRLTTSGAEWFARTGIDARAVAGRRRTLCRPCMDWSERREHLAGALGSALLTRICDFGWAKRDRNSRVIRFTPHGQQSFLALVDAAR